MLTFAICTRNRAFILGEAMDSLIPQILDRENEVDLLIVDNASADGTRELVESRMAQHPFIRYVYEPQVGLSIARNTAWQTSPDSAWIFYMDDDAKAAPDLIARSLEVIRQGKYDCFGGTYYAWFPYGKPKWLPEGFGTKKLIADYECIIEAKSKYLSGNIMAIKRKMLDHIGGFNPELGMKDSLGYGEENNVQIRMTELGFTIGFIPDMYILHAVLPHKHQLKWHFRAVREISRVKGIIYKRRSKIIRFIVVIRTCIAALIRLPGKVTRLIFRKDYYLETFALDICLPVYRSWWEYKG